MAVAAARRKRALLIVVSVFRTWDIVFRAARVAPPS